MNRLLKILLTVVGVLVLLVGGLFAAAALFLDLNKLVNEQIAQHKPEIEQKLGRKVEIGAVSTSIFPTLSARVQNVTIAPDPSHKEDDRPLMQLGAVGFEFSLWDALTSHGESLKVRTVYLDGLKVNLIRYADGTLSYQDILDRQPPKEKSEPLSPEMQARLQKLSIGEIRLGDAEVRLVDFDTPTHQPAESFVRHFNINIKDVRLSDPIHVHMDAAVFADATNFNFDTAVGPLPANLEVQGAPAIGATALKLTGVDLSRIAPYLGPAVPARIDSASANADLKVSGYANGAPTQIDGFFAIDHLQIAGGKPFDLRFETSKLALDAEKGNVDLGKTLFKLGEVELAMGGSLSDLNSTPKFHDLTIHSSTLAPGLLLAYYPPARANLPKDARVDGAAVLDVKASGDAAKQTVNAKLDLAGLDLFLPGQLVKPKGVAMGLGVDGDFTASDANLRRFETILDELDLVAQGTVKNFSAPAFDLNLSAKPFTVDRLARLLPSVKDGLEKQKAQAQGQGKIEGHLRGTATNLDAAMEIALLGAKLEVPGTKVDGDVTFKLAAKGNPKANLSADLLLDAQKATLVIPETVNKTATTPLLVTASIVRAGELVTVKGFDVHFAELQLHSDGTFDLGKGTTSLNVDMKPLDLEKFARTVTAIPAARAKGGFVDVKLAVKGNPNQLETMSVGIDPLNVRYGDSDLKGTMQVTNLVKPNATMRISSNKLDFDQLLPDDGSEKTDKSGKKKAPAEDNPKLKDYTFSGYFDAKTMVVSKTELTNFKGVVKLKDGVLTMEDCTFNVFGGLISAKGTSAEIWKGRTPFHAKLAVKGVDVGQALAAKTKYAGLLQGKGDFNVDLAGEGFETVDLEKALTGNMDLNVAAAKYNAASLTKAVVGGMAPALTKVPGMKLGETSADNAIQDLAAAFTVKDGKWNLKKPMALALDGNKVTLDGAIGVAGGLFLTGTYGMSSKVLSAVTGGRCQPKSDVPIPVKIGGTATKPEFNPDVAGALSSVVQACIAGQASSAAAAVADQAKAAAAAQAQAQADAAKKAAADAAANAKAQAEAQARQFQADAAKKAADDAAANAKAQADAQKKAAEEAAKKAKGALGKLHF